MSALNINRERAGLLADLRDGKVYRSLGGCLMRRVRGGQNRRVERKVRELQDAGLVDQSLGLTVAGAVVLSNASGTRPLASAYEFTDFNPDEPPGRPVETIKTGPML
jgi:hypothetical protein